MQVANTMRSQSGPSPDFSSSTTSTTTTTNDDVSAVDSVSGSRSASVSPCSLSLSLRSDSLDLSIYLPGTPPPPPLDPDPDLTPVNPYGPTQFDSGTESICSEFCPMLDESEPGNPGTERILHYFAETANDKSSSLRKPSDNLSNGTHRSTRARARLSLGDDDDDQDSDGFSSDESTLSESSACSPDYGLDDDLCSETNLITPETVVAAIDKQIRRQREQQTSQSTQPARSELDPKEEPIPTLESLHTLQCLNPIDTIIEEESDELDEDENSDDDDDEEDSFLRGSKRIPLIRSTSLKTGKTPPGTPCGGKKYVRFADALGLDLESVRHIVDDGQYMPPLAAFKGLKLDEEDRNWILEGHRQGTATNSNKSNSSNASKPGSKPLPVVNLPQTRPNLRIMFCQPSSDPGNFLERVRTGRVCLENCMVSGPIRPNDCFTITCIVRVLNVSFQKELTLRYTTNEWLTWTDVAGAYLPDSCDGFSDKFMVSFELAVNSNGHQTMMPGQRMLFALRYQPGDDLPPQQFWDNNLGLNYTLIYQRI